MTAGFKWLCPIYVHEETAVHRKPTSYFGIIKRNMGGKKKQASEETVGGRVQQKQHEFDVRLIPEFSGDGTVSEWLDKVTLICDLRGVSNLTEVIPLRLTGGAFAVYQQLSAADKRDVRKIKSALLAAFADDPFVAYEKFTARRLNANESPDVYLADLRRLAGLFGGVSDLGLGCAFVAGLPAEVRQALKTGCRAESLQLDQLLARARAVLKDSRDFESMVPRFGAPSIASKLVKKGQLVHGKSSIASGRRCFVCDGENHLAKDCLLRRSSAQRRENPECFRCSGPHLARACPGNHMGEEGSAPASSPDGR